MGKPHKVLPYEIDGKTLIVTPAGDSLGVEECVLEREIGALHQLIDSGDGTNLIVNVGGSGYFGSLMMGAMVALCKRATDEGGKAALCCASAGMLESIQIMRLDRVVPHFVTTEDAVAFVSR